MTADQIPGGTVGAVIAVLLLLASAISAGGVVWAKVLHPLVMRPVNRAIHNELRQIVCDELENSRALLHAIVEEVATAFATSALSEVGRVSLLANQTRSDIDAVAALLRVHLADCAGIKREGGRHAPPPSAVPPSTG